MKDHCITPSRPAETLRQTTGTLGFVALAALCAGVTTFSATQAQAQSLCSEYTVVSGDTLSRIAANANLRGGFQFLFDANSNVLSSPNMVEVGQVLVIPCADGSLPSSQTAAPEATAPAESAVRSAATDRPATFVTASGYAPFTDEDLPEGGMITQMVKRSMELGNPGQKFRVVFINDWGSHLTELLPSGAFDMAFPWFLPDCTKVDLLSEPNARRCTDFDASAPFYEAAVGYYTLTGSPYAGTTDYNQLYGATLCRPDGWFSFDLEAEGLKAPNIDLVFGKSEEACWEMLQAGEVDVVTYDALPAEEDYTEMGIAGQIVDIPALASKVTLHVFVPKDNPNGKAYLEILDAGLEQLRLSGEWFEIVRSQIQETVEN